MLGTFLIILVSVLYFNYVLHIYFSLLDFEVYEGKDCFYITLGEHHPHRD